MEEQAHVLIFSSVHAGARSLALGVRNAGKGFSSVAVVHRCSESLQGAMLQDQLQTSHLLLQGEMTEE